MNHSPASTRKPFSGQPGGGTEIATEDPIDIRGVPFQLFEIPEAGP